MLNSMFLYIDETEQGNRFVIGATVCSKDLLPLFEKECTKIRIKNKLFGEVKWSKLTNVYYDAYIDFVGEFFNCDNTTFHSVCYDNTFDKNKIIYILIKTICWKISISGNTKPLFILLDNNCIIGKEQIKIIQKYLKKDHKIRQDINFLNEGNSCILNISQINDLILGAIGCKINNLASVKYKKDFIGYLEDKNKHPIDYSTTNMPKLCDFKIHYFKPHSVA